MSKQENVSIKDNLYLFHCYVLIWCWLFLAIFLTRGIKLKSCWSYFCHWCTSFNSPASFMETFFRENTTILYPNIQTKHFTIIFKWIIWANEIDLEETLKSSDNLNLQMDGRSNIRSKYYQYHYHYIIISLSL